MYNDEIKKGFEQIERGNSIVNRLMNALFEGEDPIPLPLMLYVVSHFSARILLGAQESVPEADMLHDFTILVKNSMEVMKMNGTLRSFDDEVDKAVRAEYTKKMVEEFKRKQAALGKEVMLSPTDDEEMVN